MNGPFQTAQQLTATVLPAEFETRETVANRGDGA
jgi:hypothetical protein